MKKTFAGDLEGTSVVELLMSGSGKDETAGYVGLERITGRLDGKRGSFDLQHSAQLGGPDPRSTWLVVPGSGTGELAGISGEGRYEHATGAVFTLAYEIRIEEPQVDDDQLWARMQVVY